MSTSDQIALYNAVATSVAILLAPLFALWIGGVLKTRSDNKNGKLRILGILISLRHDTVAPDAIKSLNLIDAVFADDANVREAWTRYFAVLNDQSLNNPTGYSIRDEKRRDLLIAMIAAVKLEKKLSSADLLRAYAPQAAAQLGYITFWENYLKIKNIEEELRKRNVTFTPWAFNMANQPEPPPPSQTIVPPKS